MVLEQLLGSHLIRAAVIERKAHYQRASRRCGSGSGKHERGAHHHAHRQADPAEWDA